MDRQTAFLLDALRHPGAAFLARLLEGEATEAELLAEARDVSQATANRRLATLERLGLAEREPGNWRAPGRAWRLVHTEETDELLGRAYALTDAVASAQREKRDAARKRQKRAKAARRGMRAVEGGEGSSRP